MQGYLGNQDHGSPEDFVHRLVRHLGNQVVWDLLLTFSPPILAVIYLAAVLYPRAWMPDLPLLMLVSAIIVIGVLAVGFRFRARVPSILAAARLMDDKAEAQDRFITLTTVPSSPASDPMLIRLRREALGTLNRVELKRDFPYRVKQPFYWSALSSLALIILFHLLFSGILPKSGVSPQERIRELAEQMSQRVPLAEIGHSLQSLADKLDDLKVAPEEKHSLIEEIKKQIAREPKKEQEHNCRDLLSDASNTLKNLEQDSAGEGQREQQNAGGGVQSNAQQEGRAEEKASEGGGADSKSEVSAQLNPDMKDGKSAQGNSQGKGQEKDSGQQKEQKANQPDPSNTEKTTEDSAGKMKENAEGRSGKNRSDEMPNDGPPAERYRQPGEQGPSGIKGAKYVTVQLPEEIAADSSGTTTPSKDGKENKNRPKVSISNVPLPAHVPEASAEKQRMPLEYRDLIR